MRSPQRLTSCTLNAGERVHSAGEALGAMYIDVAGRLKMTLKTPGGGPRTLRCISAGDQFGALTLVCEDDFPVDVVVDEKAVLLRLPKDIALQLVDQFPVFRRNLLQKIGHGAQDLIHGRRRTNSYYREPQEPDANESVQLGG